MPGLIGKKVGMTSVFDENRRAVPCTVIEVPPAVVTQVKTQATDGYDAVQVAAFDAKEKNTTKPLLKHLEKAGVGAKHVIHEFDFDPADYKTGDTLTVELFTPGEFIDVVGTSKGKGFQGVVKRHGFSGVGGRTHGQHNRERAPGSMGASSYPSRVWKGKRLAGRTGGARVKVQNLQVLQVLADHNLLVVSGGVPGPKGGYLFLEK